jgi:hypothetical protein
MGDSETYFCPRGQISFGAGDLVDVINVAFNFSNNAKMRPTLKDAWGHKVLGAKTLSGTFVTVLSEKGLERDYFSRVESGEAVSMRLKMSTLTKNVEGVLTGIDGTLPLDDAIEFTVHWLGRWSD